MSNYNSQLQSNNTELSSNNLDLQALIDQAIALPDAGGVELPELTNEGTASDLLSGKQLIDGDGNKVTGTFSIDSELDTQDDLIAQIQSVVDSLPEAGGEELTLQTKIVTPTTSQQTVTPDSEYDGLSEVTVKAIPSTYIEPSTTKTATTYTPSTTNQTIAAGTYCSGVQTIKGDANLIPANIVSGKTIFGVTGSAQTGGSDGSGDIAYITVQNNLTDDIWVNSVYCCGGESAIVPYSISGMFGTFLTTISNYPIAATVDGEDAGIAYIDYEDYNMRLGSIMGFFNVTDGKTIVFYANM